MDKERLEQAAKTDLPRHAGRNLQASELERLARAGTAVSLFTTNGFRKQGVIVSSDDTCVKLRCDDGMNLIFLHAISTIQYLP